MVELPQRRILVAASLLAAALFLPIPVSTVVAVVGSDSLPVVRLVLGAVGTLLLVVVPLWGAVQFQRQRVLVGPDRVQLRFGDRVARDLAYADLTAAELAVSGSVRSLTLAGASSGGRPAGLKVTSNQVQTLDPLLDAVRTARPDLLRKP